jgi:hypothetical protein
MISFRLFFQAFLLKGGVNMAWIYLFIEGVIGVIWAIGLNNSMVLQSSTQL